LDPKDYDNLDSATLIKELEREFEISPSDKKISVTIESMEKSYLNTISNTQRQEERIAIIIDSLIQDRDIGISMLTESSRDRAKYTREIASELLSILNTREPSSFITDLEIVKLVRKKFAKGMPSNRNALLYYLSKHLCKYPEINSYLRMATDRSESIFLADQKKDIYLFLDNPQNDHSRFKYRTPESFFLTSMGFRRSTGSN
jgi:hypothetical protein